MSLLERVTRGYLWSQIGRLAEAGLLFLLSLVLARETGPRAYGIFSLGLSVVAFCGFLAAMGVGQEALGKFVPEAAVGRYPGGVPRLVGHLLAIRVLAVTALSGAVLLAGGWVERGLGAAGLRHDLGLVLLVFSLRSICELFTYTFSGLLELRAVAAARAVVPLLGVAWVGGRVLSGAGVAVGDAFGALAVGQLAALVILGFAARKGWPAPQETFDAPRGSLRRVLAFGLFAWLAGFFIFVLGDSSDVALIGWLINDARAVGLYAVGSSAIFRGLNLLLAWLPLIGMSTAANAYLEGGKERLAEAAEGVWKLIAISVVPAMFLLFWFAEPFLTLLYSEDYRAAVPVLRVLAALFAASAILGHGLHAGILYLLDRERTACAIFAAAAAGNIALAVILIHAFGIVGAAWATGVSFVFFAVLCLVLGQPACAVRWPRGFIARVVLASALACFATRWLRVDSLAAMGMAGGAWVLVFLLVLSLTKPLRAQDVRALQGIHPALGYVAERLFACSNSRTPLPLAGWRVKERQG